MSDLEIKQNIQSVLKSYIDANLTEKSLNLFKTLGYNTKRQAPLDKKTYKGFKDAYLDGNIRFNEDKAVVSEWKYIDLLFQLSKDEITTQIGFFDTKQVDRTIIETYLFFVIELSKESYSRSVLSHITREVNKVFPMPVLVLFKHGKSLTLAVINRRLHKKDEQKDVLEKVTLIKDINIENPHRAHIEIIFDLSLEELQRLHKFTNFVELHNAWQKTLDTKELNKKFYKELSNWYFWAMKEVDFPGAALHEDKKSLFKEEDKEKEHNAKNLIRLLTRLLFVWFVKEKGLIPEEIFDEKYVASELLLNFRPKKGKGASGNITSCYYRAILQNLFFATLNQNMDKREFRKQGQHMNVTNLMRYERYFKDSKKFVQLVAKIVPFLNGGLFECLDQPDLDKKGKQGGDVIIYLDGFSDREDNHLTVPDYIFFGTEDHVDLSDAYGDKDKEYKNAAIKGLINILKSYKFTVAENTPLEEEIALDPELLGRVFENLLASYNPETKITARKQTGSFYTPREIVNYMVDESLVTYLKQKLEDTGIKDKEDSLRDLISYSENQNPFSAKETQQLISAIDNCKILDPACGSGAFPMGVLHKLVHVLHKVDHKNALWKQKQIEKAQAIDDSAIRDLSIADIEEAFENNELDYGRKLYLIENCIYGVDIQPIATQISKLRFFISLIVDQKVNVKKDNLGIRPLPNLETKFVAANTLVGIEKPKAQMDFGTEGVKAIEERLKDVRHRLFSAKTPATKRKLREEDKDLREQMGILLVKNGWKNEIAHQIACWDPYDQNTSSPFFDPEWMFGIRDGFSLIIGNPPYVQIKQIPEVDKPQYIKNFKFATGRFNIFYFFIEITQKLLYDGGVASYIVPDRLLLNTQCCDLRDWLLTKQTIIELDSFDESVFDSAVVDSIILIYKNSKNDLNEISAKSNVAVDEINNRARIKIPISYFENSPNKQFDLDYSIGKSNLIEKIRIKSKPLSSISDTKDGIIQSKIPDVLFLRKKENQFCKKLLFGKDINRYQLKYDNNWVNYQHEEMMRIELKRGGGGLRLRTKDIFERTKILTRQTADEIIGTLDTNHYYYSNTLHGTAVIDKDYDIKYILALLNSRILNYYYRATTAEGGKVFAQIKIEILRQLPIKYSRNQKLFVLLVDYQLCLNSNGVLFDASFFERLMDMMVYELYLEEEVKSANCEVLKHLTNLSELKDDWSDDKKLAVIERIYKELSDPKHPVSIAMAKIQEVPEVKIIEGRDQVNLKT